MYHERKVRSISACITSKEETTEESNMKNIYPGYLFARKLSFLQVKRLLICFPFVLFLLKRNFYRENQKQFCLPLCFSGSTRLPFISIFLKFWWFWFNVVWEKWFEKMKLFCIIYLWQHFLLWSKQKSETDLQKKIHIISQNKTVSPSDCIFTRTTHSCILRAVTQRIVNCPFWKTA